MNEPNNIKPAYESPHQFGEKTPKCLIPLISFTLPFIGVAMLLVGVWILCSELYKGNIYDAISTFLIAVFSGGVFFLYGWNVVLMAGGASFRFETDGLCVKYPLHSWHMIPWDCFQQVCVLYSYTGSNPHPEICCVMKGEKTNMFGRWKTTNPFRYRTVICISYTPELHEGIKEKCPYEVIDLRGTPNYRI